MNVLLITIDALTADHLSCLGYPRNTTPNLEQLANEGAFFRSLSNGHYTRSSFPSILARAHLREYTLYQIIKLRQTGFKIIKVVGIGFKLPKTNAQIPKLGRLFPRFAVWILIKAEKLI